MNQGILTDNRSKNLLPYFTFIVWPLFSLFYSLLNYRKPYFKNIIWLFCGFYGYNFVNDGKGGDVERYSDQLVYLYNANFSFLEFLQLLIDGKYGRGDYIQPILTYLVSFISDDYRIIYLLYGLIYGYLFSRTIDLLIHYKNKKIDYQTKLLILYFAFIVPVWYINGVRFYVATYLFTYGCIAYYLLRDKKKLFFLALSPLMHFSFIIPVGLFLVHFLLPKNIWLYLTVLALSLFLFNLSIPEMVSFIPSINNQIDGTVRGYTNVNVIENVFKHREKTIWFTKLHESLLNYISFFMISCIVVLYKKIKEKEVILFVTLGILILAFSNIVDKIPSMGRFYTVSQMILSIGFILMSASYENKIFKRITFSILLFPSVFCILVTLRYCIDYMGFYTLLLNPLTSPFFEMTSNLRDVY